MKSKILPIALTMIALFVFGTTQAQNAHLSDVVVSEDGLMITGKVAGLGNMYAGQDLKITYAAMLSVSKKCYAPGNDMLVPGQSGSMEVESSKYVILKAREGVVHFELMLDATSVPSGECPPGLVEGEGSMVEAISKTISFTVGNASGSMEL